MIEIKSKSTGTKVINKPSGLEVGDLMVAVISVVRSAITGAPTGWTLVDSNNLSYNFCSVYKKIATTDDVNATNFTWTSPRDGRGIIYRISQADFEKVETGTGSIKPQSRNNIVLVIGLASDDDSDSATFSNYSVTGGMSPTFTEDLDDYSLSSAYYASIGVGSALYTSDSEITSFAVTQTGSTDQSTKSLVVIGEKPANNNFFHFF